MSKHHLRHDKICANCGHLVEQRFCSACGQENTETRQSFGHLIHHFFEDLTHYDGAFWRTMKYLLLRPAYLTKQYLAGKRSSFVPPVRLYIFISFLTFLLPHLLPQGSETLQRSKQSRADLAADDLVSFSVANRDSVRKAVDSIAGKKKVFRVGSFTSDQTFTSVEQLDSFQKAAPKSERLGWLNYRLAHNLLASHESGDPREFVKQFKEAFIQNLPKALFIYMPMFAFVLWLFHGKRRWLYFDHAIFTLHYFAFCMLLLTLSSLVRLPFNLWGSILVASRAKFIVRTVISVWFIYYFFRAHHKMYEERTIVSMLKAWPVFLINIILLAVVGIALIFASFLMMH